MSKGRITAEKMMCELDGIRPTLQAAYNTWLTIRVEYEEIMQKLCVYHKRGLITDEEFERYRVKGMRSQDLNTALVAHRKRRRDSK